MKRTLLTLAIAACSIFVYAQGEIPVNMYTGSPGIFVPLATITDHDLSETIGLSYNVNAVNSGSPYGVGWNLSGGGQVSRTVRGLPDDLYTADGRRGWLNVPSNYKAQAFANTADNSVSTCNDEQTDQGFLAGLGYLYDTEPDIYTFSVAGFSGKFVFDNTGSVRTIPYQDILIVPSIDATTKAITSWTVTTTSGVTHVLGDTCTMKKLLKKSDNQFNLSIFDREYNFYKTQTSFASAWMLSKTTSPTGAMISYQYSLPIDGVISNNTDKNIQILDVPGTSPKLVFPVMGEMITATRKLISQVTSSSGMYATFDPATGVMVYDPNRGATAFRKITLGYNSGMLTSVTESDVNSCLQLPPYLFEYNGWPGAGMGSSSHDFWGYCNGYENNVPTANAPSSAYSSSTGSLTALSYATGTAVPAGIPTHFPTIYVYPNEPANERYRIYRIPSYAGTEIILNGDANQVPNENMSLSGTLKKIVYPSGGESDFVFEINKYYDARTGSDQSGGGLRVKSITYFDGMNKLANIVKNFTYLDANGHSSGRLISRPSFVIPLWKQNTIYNSVIRKYTDLTGNAVWRDLTAVTDFDISSGDDTQGASVGYTMVGVARPGSGKAVFEYLVPAAYGDGATGGNATDWSPTLMKFARPSGCRDMSVITGAENYGYAPFANTEYDYERGLVWRKTEYNEAADTVRRTLTNYQYVYAPGVSQPTPVIGLAYDHFGNADDATFLYGRYSLLTNVAKVVASESVTTYDENSTRRSTTSSQYTYGSSNHRFVTKVARTMPEGTVYASRFMYVPDYPAVQNAPDTTVQMIYSLKALNRTNTVIEQWSTVTPAGGSENTTGASLTVFRPFTVNKPLVRYQMVYRPAVPDVNFVPANIANNTFTPYGYSAGAPFGVYEKVNTVLEYDAFDLPISAMGENLIASGALLGYTKQLPVARFTNTRSNGIAFSDFETTTVSSFGLTGNYYYSDGRTGANGVHASATLTATIAKPSAATNYVLSYWAKPQSGQTSIALQLTFKDTNGNVLSTLNPAPGNFASGNMGYQLFTNVVPVASLPSTFTVQIQGQVSAPSGPPPSGVFTAGLLPLIDDISFIPDFATLTSTTYAVPFGASSVTDPTGITAYTTYDVVGRPILLKDQDLNIRKRFTYNANGQVLTTGAVASLQSSSPLIVGTPIVFVATPNPCVSGVTYKWRFDNDTTWIPSPAGSNSSPSHVYTSTGNYTVQLLVNGPGAPTPPTLIPIVVQSSRTLGINLAWTGIDGNGFATFTSTNDQPPGTISSWQWSMRPRSTATTYGNWSKPVPGKSTYTLMTLRGYSFDIKCTVTTLDGQIQDSNVITVWNEAH